MTFAQAIKDPFSVEMVCHLNQHDTETHLHVRDWSNKKLSQHIKAVIADELGRKNIMSTIESKKEGVKLDEAFFFNSKVLKTSQNG